MQYSALLALAGLAAAAPQPATTPVSSGISLTGFFASDQCQFTSVDFQAGLGCQDFPAPVESFKSRPVNTHQLTIYANSGCKGAGTTVHLDFDGCFNASIAGIPALNEPGSKTAASYCIQQEKVPCP